jgi:uroporphyrinogen-III synthase
LADPRKASLAEKRIVVTRAAEQSGDLVRTLEERGAEVLLLPLVRFALPEDCAALDEQLRRLGTFDAVLFLSANAVRYVFERCRALGIAYVADHAPRWVAAVGPATARAVRDENVRVDYIASEHTGEALARELTGAIAGRSIFLPRSDHGNEAVSRALQKAGASVTEVIAYTTAMPEAIDSAIVDEIRRAEVDVVIFASPSAVENFAMFCGAEELAKVAQRISFAAIGPTTAQALRDAGLPVTIEAAESSAEGLAGAIAEFYGRQAETVRRTQ